MASCLPAPDRSCVVDGALHYVITVVLLQQRKTTLRGPNKHVVHFTCLTVMLGLGVSLGLGCVVKLCPCCCVVSFDPVPSTDNLCVVSSVSVSMEHGQQTLQTKKK